MSANFFWCRVHSFVSARCIVFLSDCVTSVPLSRGSFKMQEETSERNTAPLETFGKSIQPRGKWSSILLITRELRRRRRRELETGKEKMGDFLKFEEENYTYNEGRKEKAKWKSLERMSKRGRGGPRRRAFQLHGAQPGGRGNWGREGEPGKTAVGGTLVPFEKQGGKKAGEELSLFPLINRNQGALLRGLHFIWVSSSFEKAKERGKNAYS